MQIKNWNLPINLIKFQKNNDLKKYEDILELPHHISRKHPQMSLSDRAAQFSPFAALTGHSDAIKEAARLTETEILLNEDVEEELDKKFQILREKVNEKPEIMILYFLDDDRKAGGKYKRISGNVHKISDHEGKIQMTDGTEIEIRKILELQGSLFNIL